MKKPKGVNLRSVHIEGVQYNYIDRWSDSTAKLFKPGTKQFWCFIGSGPPSYVKEQIIELLDKEKADVETTS